MNTYTDSFWLILEPEFVKSYSGRSRRVTGFRVTGLRRSRPDTSMAVGVRLSMPANLFDMRIEAAMDAGLISFPELGEAEFFVDEADGSVSYPSQEETDG